MVLLHIIAAHVPIVKGGKTPRPEGRGSHFQRGRVDDTTPPADPGLSVAVGASAPYGNGLPSAVADWGKAEALRGGGLG
jgi:hypothetical protein